jgi:hypothetical protein
MPYLIGARGSYGCSGYPVIKEGTSDVMGCHDTREAAGRQIAAIEANENKVGIKNPQEWPVSKEKDGNEIDSVIKEPYSASTKPSALKKPQKKRRRNVGGVGGNPVGAIATTNGGTSMGTKADEQSASIKEGDFVMGQTTEGIVHGVVEHIMWEGGVYGQPGTEYAIQSDPNNPAMAVRVYEEDEDGDWVPTAYSIGMIYSAAIVVDMESHDMDDEDYEDMEYMSKAETYSPTSGMKAAARRALKWKEDGKATGAGTPVGWGRATDIVAGRSMSLSVVRRMFSFFSRHEVDKKGKDFYNTSNPSNGRIMWDAWGGDAGFSWSRGIVNRMRDKALFANFGKDYTTAHRMVVKSLSVGSMVSWNSSGGRAEGKITRIIRNGKYNVPGTEITVSGTPDDPAAVIRLYRDGKPTDITVAHKLSTLRVK